MSTHHFLSTFHNPRQPDSEGRAATRLAFNHNVATHHLTKPSAALVIAGALLLLPQMADAQKNIKVGLTLPKDMPTCGIADEMGSRPSGSASFVFWTGRTPNCKQCFRALCVNGAGG